MENNFLSLIKTRRSVRATTATCPFQGFGRCTGSRDLCTYRRRTSIPYHHCNHRPQIPAGNRQVKRRSDGEQYRPLLWRAVVILVLADGSANTFVEDGSCVLENMMLAAHALGLGTVWVHREREIFDSEKGKALLREWKLPETLRGVGAIALGYPAQEAGQPAARKQNYIVRI